MSAIGNAGTSSFRATWHVGPLELMPANDRACEILKSAGCMIRADEQFYEWAAQYPSATKADRDYVRAVRVCLSEAGVTFE